MNSTFSLRALAAQKALHLLGSLRSAAVGEPVIGIQRSVNTSDEQQAAERTKFLLRRRQCQIFNTQSGISSEPPSH